MIQLKYWCYKNVTCIKIRARQKSFSKIIFILAFQSALSAAEIYSALTRV